MHLSPSLELKIRDHLALMPYFIAIEGTQDFDTLAHICIRMQHDDAFMSTFTLTEVCMPDGEWVDAIVVSQLPAACCATL